MEHGRHGAWLTIGRDLGERVSGSQEPGWAGTSGWRFALLHLAYMRRLGEVVPPDLAATAQAIYGTVAIGAVTSLLTLLSGTHYVWLGGGVVPLRHAVHRADGQGSRGRVKK